MLPGEDGEPMKLIEVSAAGADDRPVVDASLYVAASPKAGYWFRAIRHADESEPSPDRFAFCSFPATYGSSGRLTFILDERNSIYQRDLGRRGGIDVFPTDEELDSEWTRLN